MQQIVRSSPWPRGPLVVAAMAGLVMGFGPAEAGQSAGCDAANNGRLNFSVAPGANAVRQAALEEGEALSISVATSGRATVAVTDGGGSRTTLHAGRSTSVRFVAPSSASYALELGAGEDVGAKVSVTCVSVVKAETERALLARRKAFLAERDPDRIRIDRPPAEPKPLDDPAASATGIDPAAPRDVTASISLSELAAALKLGPKTEPGILDFWFEGRYTTYDTVDLNLRPSDGNFTVMYFGTKYMLGPDIMLGALAQFDQAGEGMAGSKISASGWMAGPYVSMRFGPGIVFDGRAAWGVAESAPQDLMIDAAPAERRLLRGTLRGNRDLAGWTFAPSVGLSYVQDAPADPAIDQSSAAGTGRLDVLPEFKRRFTINSETYVEPRVAAGGFLSFDDISEIRPGLVGTQLPDVNWKAEAGVALGKTDSLNVQATGGVETNQSAATDTWSGRLQLNMPLGK